MIRFLKRNEIAERKWDAAVSGSWHETAYGYCWYLDCVTVEWAGLVLEDYSAVMPLVIAQKWGIHYILNVPFLQYITIYGLRPDKALFLRFLQAIPKRYRYIDFKILLPFKPEIPGGSVIERTNYILPLNQTAEALEMDFNTNTRRNLKKAESAELTVNHESDPTEMIDAYIAFKREKYNAKPDKAVYTRFRKLINTAILNGTGELMVARDKNNGFNGATYFQNSGSRSIYLFSSALAEAKNNGAMFLIVKKQIGKLAGTGQIMDFEGSDIEGVARFYKGFGSEQETYFQIKINRLPQLFKHFKR